MSKKSSKPNKKEKDVIDPKKIRFDKPRDRFIMVLDLDE